jgi:5'(3')-deoxyribonucleotidase
MQLPLADILDRIHAFQALDHGLVEPMEEAREVIEELSARYELNIITARNPQFENMTRAWVEAKFPHAFSRVISVGHPAVMELPQTKAEICQYIGARVLIDDPVKHLSQCAEDDITGVLFGNYPWNQAESLPKGVTRCEDWPAVLEYFDARG